MVMVQHQSLLLVKFCQVLSVHVMKYILTRLDSPSSVSDDDAISIDSSDDIGNNHREKQNSFVDQPGMTHLTLCIYY